MWWFVPPGNAFHMLLVLVTNLLKTCLAGKSSGWPEHLLVQPQGVSSPNLQSMMPKHSASRLPACPCPVEILTVRTAQVGQCSKTKMVQNRMKWRWDIVVQNKTLSNHTDKVPVKWLNVGESITWLAQRWTCSPDIYAWTVYPGGDHSK